MHKCGNRVCASIYSKSKLSPHEIAHARTIIEHGLGKDENLKGFYEFAKSDPILRKATKDLSGMRSGTLDSAFDRIILAILLQMAPIKRSRQMMDLMLENFGTKLKFDGQEVILWPRAETIAAAGEEHLRDKANLGYRAGRLVSAAEYLVEDPISLGDLEKLPAEEALARLKSIPGIGSFPLGSFTGGRRCRSIPGAPSS
ncbi:MAG: hypothetical protein TUN42_08980 [Dehalogenimonas sp.]